jgi:hypothetical protein
MGLLGGLLRGEGFVWDDVGVCEVGEVHGLIASVNGVGWGGRQDALTIVIAKREHTPGAKAPIDVGLERAKPEGLAYLDAKAPVHQTLLR